ncbi:MAG: activator of (R)-2-hydroxyglutaryl-CoA dehydratase [Planctomycetota bacterium]|nr:activator of (R)-2-hydroxyglutaryl-CoA dehydratase [Planctomycetota bacterium]
MVQTLDQETDVRRLVEQERARLLKEAGLSESRKLFQRPVERPFTADQRAHTTLLFGGLTVKHEELIKGSLAGMGYTCENMPIPDVKAFQLGKEYGNNGQCNPTYFTVGNLVQYLQKLRDSGMEKQRILQDYVFLTAGACGPCRFGMYEAEYRLALRNSGFDGFRVILFQQKGGLSQSDVEAGLRMDMDFFLSLVSAISIGDLLNEVGYLVRPFEVEPGATNRALDRCTEMLRQAMHDRPFYSFDKSKLKGLRRWRGLSSRVETLGKFWQQVRTRHYTDVLEECRKILAEVQVDRTRVAPIVKITGEFWAQTTEGDGNFNMFRFLEGEGAEVLVEPVATWLLYMLWQVKQGYRDRFGLPGNRNPFRLGYRLARIVTAEKLFTREYNRFRKALGDTTHAPVCQMHLQRLGHPYYHSRSQGGEGHLEVAKNIHYASNKLCHMVLSLKPFGCMPSTQSDGAQAAVVSHFSDMIFLPVETSGEGEINAHSRVQMALGEARRKAKEEFAEVLQTTGRSLEEIRAYVDTRPELRSALYKVPKDKRYSGTAANFVTHVAALMENGR